MRPNTETLTSGGFSQHDHRVHGDRHGSNPADRRRRRATTATWSWALRRPLPASHQTGTTTLALASNAVNGQRVGK